MYSNNNNSAAGAWPPMAPTMIWRACRCWLRPAIQHNNNIV